MIHLLLLDIYYLFPTKQKQKNAVKPEMIKGQFAIPWLNYFNILISQNFSMVILPESDPRNGVHTKEKR